MCNYYYINFCNFFVVFLVDILMLPFLRDFCTLSFSKISGEYYYLNEIDKILAKCDIENNIICVNSTKDKKWHKVYCEKDALCWLTKLTLVDLYGDDVSVFN